MYKKFNMCTLICTLICIIPMLFEELYKIIGFADYFSHL